MRVQVIVVLARPDDNDLAPGLEQLGDRGAEPLAGPAPDVVREHGLVAFGVVGDDQVEAAAGDRRAGASRLDGRISERLVAALHLDAVVAPRRVRRFEARRALPVAEVYLSKVGEDAGVGLELLPDAAEPLRGGSRRGAQHQDADIAPAADAMQRQHPAAGQALSVAAGCQEQELPLRLRLAIPLADPELLVPAPVTPRHGDGLAARAQVPPGEEGDALLGELDAPGALATRLLPQLRDGARGRGCDSTCYRQIVGIVIVEAVVELGSVRVIDWRNRHRAPGARVLLAGRASSRTARPASSPALA